jgi:hypothetical protein
MGTKVPDKKPLTEVDVIRDRMLKLRQDMTPQDVRKHILAICLKEKYNPVEELVAIAQGTDDAELAAKIHMELLSYMAPKLKAMQVQGSISGTIKVSIQNFTQQIIEGKVIDVPVGDSKELRVIGGDK